MVKIRELGGGGEISNELVAIPCDTINETNQNEITLWKHQQKKAQD